MALLVCRIDERIGRRHSRGCASGRSRSSGSLRKKRRPQSGYADKQKSDGARQQHPPQCPADHTALPVEIPNATHCERERLRFAEVVKIPTVE
jgi:hypothetical protein